MNFRQQMIAARNNQFSPEGAERSKSRAQARRYSVKSSSSSAAWDEVADVKRGEKKEFVKTSYLYRSNKQQDSLDPDADLRSCMF